MKKSTLFLVAMLLLSMSSAHAQETEIIPRTIFKLSPQHFLNNSLKAGVERFNQNYAGSVAFFITGMLENTNRTFDRQGAYNGMAGELQFRKYLSRMKQHTSRRERVYSQGIFGGAYLQGGSYSGDFEDYSTTYDPVTEIYDTQVYHYEENILNWGFGFTIGYQKTIWEVIFMEAFIGGGIQFADRNMNLNRPIPPYYNDPGIADPGYKGILPKIGLHIGIGL